MRPGDTGDDSWKGSEPDRPIDIEAVRADDELVEALVAGVVRAPRERSTDPEAALRAMLSAWVLDVRPETVVGADLPAGPAPAVPGDRPPADPAQEPTAEPAGVIPITVGRRRLTVHPRYVRRFAAAAAMIVLLGSGLAVGAWDAQPGGTLWAVTKVFYAERAKSVQAAADVTTGLERARTALKVGDRAQAAEAIASVAAVLPQVAPDQGHDMLVAQQQEIVVALGDTLIPPDAAPGDLANPLPSTAPLAPTSTAAAASTPAPASSSPAAAVVTTAPAAAPPVVAPPAANPPADTAPAGPAPADPAPPAGPATNPPPPASPDPQPPAGAEQVPTGTEPASTPPAANPPATNPGPTTSTDAPAPAAPPADAAAPANVAAPANSAAPNGQPAAGSAGGGSSPGLIGTLVNVVTGLVGAILDA